MEAVAELSRRRFGSKHQTDLLFGTPLRVHQQVDEQFARADRQSAVETTSSPIATPS
jgi:hypothetical protein